MNKIMFLAVATLITFVGCVEKREIKKLPVTKLDTQFVQEKSRYLVKEYLMEEGVKITLDQTKAEILIKVLGNVEIQKIQTAEIDLMLTCQADISLEVIDSQKKEVLAISNTQGKGVEMNETAGGIKALESAARQSIEDIKNKIGKNLSGKTIFIL